MAESDTIKEFLIPLRYTVDGAAEKRFANSIAFATGKVLLLVQAAEKAAEVVFNATSKFIAGMENLYYASQRTGASVGGIEAFQFAAEHLGASAQEALGTLENLGHFLRTTPGAEGFIHNLGVSTRDAAGNLRDTSEVLIDIGKKLGGMSFAKANLYSGILGIDEKTLIALRNGEFEREYKKFLALSSNVNFKKAAEEARQFENRIREIKAQFGLLATEAESALLSRLLPALEKLGPRIRQAFDFLKSSEFKDGLADISKSLEPLLIDFEKITAATVKISVAMAQAFGPTLIASIKAVADAVVVLVDGLAYLATLVTGDTEGQAQVSENTTSGLQSLNNNLNSVITNVVGGAWNRLNQLSAEIIPSSITAPIDRMSDKFLGTNYASPSGSSPTLNQTTTINVNGSEPTATAAAVAHAQDRVNARAARAFANKVDAQ